MPSMRVRDEALRALSHEATDRIPFDSIASTRSGEVAQIVESLNLSEEVRAYYLDGSFQYLEFGSREEREPFRPYLPGLPDAASVSDWGIGSIPLTTGAGFHAGHKDFNPLESVHTTRELASYPFPDLAEPWRHEELDSRVRDAKARGFVVVGQMSQTVLETAYRMRGIERLLTDLHERPDYVATLFELIAERRHFQARRFAEAGVDVLRIGDDIATQRGLLISPASYRQHVRPFHADVVAATRAVNPDIHVLYHSDGNLGPLLPDLIEIGVTAINPVQPECMDLGAVKREFGRDLTLWGCCPVQSVYASGSHADVADHVRLLKGILCADGGLVVQFYNMLLTPKVEENLRFFFREFAGE